MAISPKPISIPPRFNFRNWELGLHCKVPTLNASAMICDSNIRPARSSRRCCTAALNDQLIPGL